jgi:predicted anti-sigma-YlaC factor YlaD
VTALDCGDVRDAAPEFAFGVLDGDVRAEVVVHIDNCAACRTLVTELSETADSLVLVAPEAEPPPGFEHRVVAASTGVERRRRLRTAKVAVAVAAAATILSVVGVRVIDGARDAGRVAVPATTVVAMVDREGKRVGDVELTPQGATTSLAVTVDYTLEDGKYRVVLEPDGRRLGTMTVAGRHGSWAVAARLGPTPTRLVLVDDRGEPLCSAELPGT